VIRLLLESLHHGPVAVLFAVAFGIVGWFATLAMTPPRGPCLGERSVDGFEWRWVAAPEIRVRCHMGADPGETPSATIDPATGQITLLDLTFPDTFYTAEATTMIVLISVGGLVGGFLHYVWEHRDDPPRRSG